MQTGNLGLRKDVLRKVEKFQASDRYNLKDDAYILLYISLAAAILGITSRWPPFLLPLASNQRQDGRR